MAEDEVGKRRASKGKDRVEAETRAIVTAPKTSGKWPEGVPHLSTWLATQHLHPEEAQSAAARHVIERWDLVFVPVSKIYRTLSQERSEHTLGLQLLLDEYRDTYGDVIGPDYLFRATGANASLVPVGVEYCSKCRKHAVPGTGLCGNHGGQWITEEDRAHLSRTVSDRMLGLSESAVMTLADLMTNANSELVRMQAATAILDRSGLGSETTVKHTFEPAEAEKAANTVQERLTQLGASAQAAIEARQREEQRRVEELAEVVDAEIVS